MLTTRLKGDTLREIIKEGVDGAGVSSFYTVIKFEFHKREELLERPSRYWLPVKMLQYGSTNLPHS
jgi:hypothetical protein